jgi:outer membrane receptor protein involved in Fe transport
MYNSGLSYVLGISSSLSLLLMQPAMAQTSSLKIANSCLPASANNFHSQGTVIEREQIEARSRFFQNSRQLLTSEVPGLSAFGHQQLILRAEPVRIFLDGVPVDANNHLLSTLDLDLIERIEVIPGPSILC